MSAFCETPVFDQLCTEWNVPPASGIKGLVTVIEGLSQSQSPQMALPAVSSSGEAVAALETVSESVTLVFEDEMTEGEPKVIEGDAKVRVTRKRTARVQG